MSTQASWLDKQWTIDSNGIKALNGITLAKELDVDENESKDGKNPTNTRGFKPQTLTLSHKVALVTGGDPRKELESWRQRCGKRAGFYLNGQRFGPPVLILDKVEFASAFIDNQGRLLEADISLTFSEDVNTVAAPAAATELFFGDIATPGKTPGYNPSGKTTASAYNIRPSSSAAAEKS